MICDGFDENDVALIETFAVQASIAIENSRLYSDVKNYADDLKQSLDTERTLRVQTQKMGAYIPKEVVDQIERSREEKIALGGKVVRATMMFSDIVGFTRLSERLGARKSSRLSQPLHDRNVEHHRRRGRDCR